MFQNARRRQNHGQVQATPLGGPTQAEAGNVTGLGIEELFEQANGCYPQWLDRINLVDVRFTAR